MPLFRFHFFNVVEIINGIMGKIRFTFTAENNKSQKMVEELNRTNGKVKNKISIVIHVATMLIVLKFHAILQSIIKFRMIRGQQKFPIS